MNIKSNSITNKNGNSDVNLIYGATLPSGSRLNVQGNVNITSGVSTVAFLTTSNAISGIVTAPTFIGNGNQLTGISTITSSRSIALRYIIGDHPHRS